MCTSAKYDRSKSKPIAIQKTRLNHTSTTQMSISLSECDNYRLDESAVTSRRIELLSLMAQSVLDALSSHYSVVGLKSGTHLSSKQTLVKKLNRITSAVMSTSREHLNNTIHIYIVRCCTGFIGNTRCDGTCHNHSYVGYVIIHKNASLLQQTGIETLSGNGTKQYAKWCKLLMTLVAIVYHCCYYILFIKRSSIVFLHIKTV